MINVDILPIALGIAISPIPVIAVIIMLFSVRAKSNGIFFAGAWFLTIAIVTTGIVIFALGQEVVTVDDSSGTQWIDLMYFLYIL